MWTVEVYLKPKWKVLAHYTSTEEAEEWVRNQSTARATREAKPSEWSRLYKSKGGFYRLRLL